MILLNAHLEGNTTSDKYLSSTRCKAYFNIQYSVNIRDETKALVVQVLETGVAKSIVRVARVVHLLLRTSNFFQLTCPWTSENILYLRVFFENYSSRNLKFTIFFTILFLKFGS